ncbi:IS1595 family transposase [uncultured Sneathiella sp.]|jgi:transposase-like protein|uniref:IS1595 family transposase n=1 Tax=uncultured Sneathiella sp. TaxID=879315 RepID=UPI0030DAF14E|tara:strand:+ start:576 stop:1484 length:909 start_codon:yes stop_codon:yes gene_type:complete
MSVLSKEYFHNEEAAIAHLESILWGDEPICPHCGSVGNSYKIGGKSARPGLRKCGDCRKQYTVKVGTVFESSHVPLYKWLQATFLMVSSKKGISAHQLHRVLEVTYKTAWFMAHRLREAMRDGGLDVFGGEGGTVEVDETFIGHDKDIKPKYQKKGRGYAHKHKVLALVDRDTGRARSMVVDSLKATALVPILKENIAKETRVLTDEAGQYKKLGNDFAKHDFVRHGIGEYGRGEIHTNTIEGYFSIFKRGMKGVYQHCAKRHLHRYLAEYDFRYNERKITDSERSDIALRGIVGKRLTYAN